MILDTSRITFEVVRGDTFCLPLKLNSGTRERPEEYRLQCNDKLYVGITFPGQPFENAKIRATLDRNSPRDNFGNTLLQLSSEATQCLEPGKYYISIKFVSGRNVNTLLDQKLFFVTGTPSKGCAHA